MKIIIIKEFVKNHLKIINYTDIILLIYQKLELIFIKIIEKSSIIYNEQK